MSFIMPDLMPAIPEMFLLGAACLILLVDVFLREDRRIVTYWLTLATLAGLAWIVAALPGDRTIITFNGTFILDPMARVLKLFATGIMAVVFVYGKDDLQQRDLFKGEFFTLGLFGLLGIMVMISAHSFVTLYLGLELLSLSLYALVALDGDSGKASEAAMKYFVLGAIASGMLLYGMSILYGVTGTLDLGILAGKIAGTGSNLALVFALAFVIVGLAFKFGAVPFHMWVPDVYEGAPTPVTLYIGSVPKIAAFAIFMRMLAQGLGGLHADWQQILIVLSVLSMAVGSVIAIAQSNIKRMLAYSTISHVGFILLGILAGTPEGYQAAMFYTLTYVIMATAGFGMIILLSRKGFEAEHLVDFRGLNERSPWFAAVMMFVMFGMAGVPPFVGFYAKIAVLKAILDQGMVWLAAAAVLFSVISAYYYIRVVKIMYFDRPEGEVEAVTAGGAVRWVLSGNGLAILFLGIFPGTLMAVCARVLGF